MKRYSDQAREDAAMICSIAACGGVKFEGLYIMWRSYVTIASQLDLPSEATHLATRAHIRVMETLKGDWTCEVDAEAEALIRTGWTP